MCIAVAAKVIEINKERKVAKVCVSGNELEINISLISPNMGDYVLVHAGCGIEIIKQDTATEIMELYKTIEELANNEY